MKDIDALSKDDWERRGRGRRKEEEELKPGPVWGGWWFWEPPPGKTKESPADTYHRLNPAHNADNSGGENDRRT